MTLIIAVEGSVITIILNRPFPSSETSHFQNEVKFKSILVKMNCICMRIKKKHCHINVFALSEAWGKILGNGLFPPKTIWSLVIALKLISGISDCTYFHINSKLSKNNWYQPRVYEDINGDVKCYQERIKPILYRC